MERKILLLLPALQQEKDREYRLIKYSRFPPLSLLTLAGLTPKDDYSITIRDEHIESGIVDDDFDLVGIQTYISSAYRAYQLAAHYRRRGAKIVLGGLHPTSMPEEALNHADAICIGPAESVWSEILRDFERGTLKRIYRGEPKGSAQLVPLPRWDLVDHRKYLIRNTMVTSRGCPHSCSFCYKSGFWGPRYYEARPIEEIEKELAMVDDGMVFFLDDNLLGNRHHARALFDVLRGSGIVWQAAASMDVIHQPGYLDEAYKAGCRSLFVGFESLSSQNMRSVNKSHNILADYGEAVGRFHDSGIMVNSSFVFGFDCDGQDVFDRTVEFTIEHKLETATFHILTPFPGTPLFNKLDQDGRLLHKSWSRYDTDHAVFQPARMSPDELEEGHQHAYREFLRYGSIVRRSFGMPGVVKRLAYNIAWMKVDPLWEGILRFGLMPFARNILNRVLRLNTKKGGVSATTRLETEQSQPALN